jgi:uncharacterized protein YdhG (YjbR/CyaY superfamily)
VRLNSFKTVDAYIAACPAEVQPMLHDMRKTIVSAAPQAEEGISYGMPAYKLNGALVYFGAFTKHIGFFPTALGIKAFATELKPYVHAKGSVQFPYAQPLPLGLIKRIVRSRVKENLAK